MAIFGIYSSHRAKFKSKLIFSPINSNAPAFFKVLELSRSEYIYIECILNNFLLNVHIVFFTGFWKIFACFDGTLHVWRVIDMLRPQIKVFCVSFYIFLRGPQNQINPTMSKSCVIPLPTWWIPFVTSSWFLVI